METIIFVQNWGLNILIRRLNMPNWLWVIIIILLVLWVLGLVGHVLGALINVLLVIALILAVLWLIRRIRP
jgi:hypothetical protein